MGKAKVVMAPQRNLKRTPDTHWQRKQAVPVRKDRQAASLKRPKA